jgi:glycosyltransferase involved in cell wall biosynthesis
MTERPTLGLGRHAETEAIGSGASCGTRFLFSSLEQGLRRHFDLVRVPFYYHAMDGRGSLRVATEILDQVDACLFGLPRTPFDLDPFFLVRDRLQKRTPFLYMPLGEFPRGAWYYRHIHQFLTSRDAVLVSCQADRAIHDALVGATPAHVAVVPFGIDTERFLMPAGARAATRRHLGIGPEEVVFVYHGRLTTEKNIHSAIMLFRRIVRDHPAVRLWIVGDIEDPPQEPGLIGTFRAMLRDDGLANRVTFWGGLAPDAIPRILGAADIAINLTTNGDENFGYGVVEAMAAGVPVIGTDWGGLRDTIEHGVTGFRVPTVVTPIGVGVDHWCAWHAATLLVESAERRRRMSAAARARAARAFSLRGFADAVAGQVFARVSTRPGRRAPRHVWSALGRRVSEKYSAPTPGDPGRAVPCSVPRGPTLLADHPLMRKVLAPYASRVQEARPVPDAVFFLATELLEWHGANLRSADPRYVFSIRLDPVDRAVVGLVAEHGFYDEAAVMQCLGARFGLSQVRAALRRLFRAGVLLSSKGRQAAELGMASPDPIHVEAAP